MLVNGKDYRSVWFENNKTFFVDQKKIPFNFEIVSSSDFAETASFIRDMTVRGATAIGAAGAFGMAQAAIEAEEKKDFHILELARDRLVAARPTAVDLKNCVERVYNKSVVGKDEAIHEANKISEEIVSQCTALSNHGNDLIKDHFKIATHCNTGWLAAVDVGTALGVVFAANKSGKNVFVFVDETRPRNQGSRLTAWELSNEGINHAVIADNALAYYMQKGEVDIMIVGTDRVLLNGDIANKIGTLEKAIIAKEFGVPFYVAAPITTFDREHDSVGSITIEERSADEVLYQYGQCDDGKIGRVRVASPGSDAKNPAFDITPAKYITGLITPHGIIKPEKSEILKLIKTR
ncbi:MAG: S-methyl-5-thioribose-1-phosphate isomerase [Candidatus Aenigmatarchaeota archaeon]